MQYCVKFVSKISTSLALKILKKLFFTPTRKKSRQEVKEYYKSGKTSYIEYKDEKIFKFEKGEGPTVLFIHGWGSYTYRFRFIIDELVDQGYKVLAFDYPAHGNSTGKKTNIVEIKNFIQKSTKKENIHAIVGHSFGATVSVLALAENLSTDKLITIGLPSNARLFVEYFAAMIDLSKEMKSLLYDAIEQEVEESYEQISPLTKDIDNGVDILLLHDEHDNVIPIEESYRFAEKNSNTRIIKTRELGHRNILYDDQVKQNISRFLIEN